MKRKVLAMLVPALLVAGAANAAEVTLILQRKVQAINLTKEAIVTVGCNTVGTTVHEIVGTSIGIATKFWQHIGPCFDVIYDTVVTTIIESTILTKT